VNKAIKILAFALLVAAAVVVIHHLPNFEGVMRKIHGG
jgi:hypothetical protein